MFRLRRPSDVSPIRYPWEGSFCQRLSLSLAPGDAVVVGHLCDAQIAPFSSKDCSPRPAHGVDRGRPCC